MNRIQVGESSTSVIGRIINTLDSATMLAIEAVTGRLGPKLEVFGSDQQKAVCSSKA